MASIPIPRRYRTVLYIPSKNDGTMLEVCLSIPTTVSAQPQVHTGVVIAHPYGPLGGSYNNNVVGALLQWFETHPLQAATDSTSTSARNKSTQKTNASLGHVQEIASSETEAELATEKTSPSPSLSRQKSQSSSKSQAARLSCVICAFNFRGCGKSKGKTSWFGEAERDDYQTVVDFLQSGSHAGSSHLENSERRDSGTSTPAVWSGKVYDEAGLEVDPPRLPFLSRFILSGFSYGGMIASTITPPLRNPTDPSSGNLPTTYILVSYPAGVAWLLTSGAQGYFSKRARAILLGENSPTNHLGTEAIEGDGKQAVEAYFITGGQDQFTSPRTLISWLQTNAGLDPPKQLEGSLSWTSKRPEGAIHLDVIEDMDHFWLDREQELLDKLQKWWSETHT